MRLYWPDMEVYRAEVCFTGHVQGVGFRYQTLQVAREFAVTGTVENLADGRVRLVVEGDEKEVEAFIAELSLQMEKFIREAERKVLGGVRRFRNFEIVG